MQFTNFYYFKFPANVFSLFWAGNQRTTKYSHLFQNILQKIKNQFVTYVILSQFSSLMPLYENQCINFTENK